MINISDTREKDVYSFNIFETEGLAEKLMQCSNIDILPYDEYPPNVCNVCCICILDFVDFQKMCQESLNKFTKILEGQREIEQDGNYVESKLGNGFSDEMILGDCSDKTNDTERDVIEMKCDFNSDERVEANKLEDFIIIEATGIAKRGTLKNNVISEHNYCQSVEVSIVCSGLPGCDKRGVKSGDTNGNLSGNVDDVSRLTDYNNMQHTISSIDDVSYRDIIFSVVHQYYSHNLILQPLYYSSYSSKYNSTTVVHSGASESGAKNINGISNSEIDKSEDEKYLFNKLPLHEKVCVTFFIILYT